MKLYAYKPLSFQQKTIPGAPQSAASIFGRIEVKYASNEGIVHNFHGNRNGPHVVTCDGEFIANADSEDHGMAVANQWLEQMIGNHLREVHLFDDGTYSGTQSNSGAAATTKPAGAGICPADGVASTAIVPCQCVICRSRRRFEIRYGSQDSSGGGVAYPPMPTWS